MVTPSYETDSLRSCPLCQGRALEALPLPRRSVGGIFADAATDRRLGLARCTSCGFEFVDPRPDDAALESFYRGHDYTAHEPVDDAAANRRARIQLDAIERALGPVRGSAILDVGCGGGHFLELARGRGAVPCGLDVASHALAACARRGIEVKDRADALAGRRFDGVVMSHVLEHVANVRDALASCRRFVRHAPGGGRGWVCIEVPNVESLRARLSTPLTRQQLGADERHRAFPIHLSYFSPRTLRRALADAGFEVVRLRTAGGGTSPVKRLFHRALFGENLLAIARTARG